MRKFISSPIGVNDQYFIGSAFWKVHRTVVTFPSVKADISSCIIPCTLIVDKQKGYINIYSVINSILTRQNPSDRSEHDFLDMWVTYEANIPLNTVNRCQLLPAGGKRLVEILLDPHENIQIKVSAHIWDSVHSIEEDTESKIASTTQYLLDLNDWGDAAVSLLLSFVDKSV